MLNGRSVSTNVVNRYLTFLFFVLLKNRTKHLQLFLLFSASDASPPVPRPRSSSTRSADDVSNDTRVTNGSNRLSADLDNYAQVKHLLFES